MKYLALTILLIFSLAGPASAQQTSVDDVSRVKAVLQAYKEAIESLDGSRASPLFALDAKIFEQGGLEGTWAQYLEHHLGPEFGEFVSLQFTDYDVTVEISGDVAVAWETYHYTIVLKEAAEPIVRKGAATSVLERTGDGWTISLYHSSSRKPAA